jgi:Tfp pilus assembly protein PilX
MKSSTHWDPRRRQRGAATLIVVLILFFVVSLVAAYTNRNLIFEQRTANNQYRSTQALEAAEAGLEWAIGLLNLGRVDGSCVSSATTSDLPFRQRYLSIDGTGRISPTLTSSGGEMSAACVFTGSGWQCSCPSNGAPTLTVPTGAGLYPAFKVRFQRILGDMSSPTTPRQPGVVRVQVVGCTRADSTSGDQCLQFDGGLGATGEGRVVLNSLLALSGTASSPPQAALVAKGSVNAAISAYNSTVGGSGITVQAGGTISGVNQLVSLAGSSGGLSSAIANDAAMALPDLSGAGAILSNDRMFAAVFNLRPDVFKEQPAAFQKTCGSTGCTASDVRSIASAHPWRPIWLSGGLDVDSTGDIGSPSQPVLLVVNGDLTFTSPSVTIYGVVYIRTTGGQWTTAGAGQVVGAVVVDGDVVGLGTTSLIFDPGVIALIRWNTGSFVRVPGSWRDFE